MPWPFLGRMSEMRRLEGVLAEPLPRGVLIRGQIGIGKSRLLAEFVNVAAEAGWSVERVTGGVASASVPLGVAAQLIPELPTGPWDTADSPQRTRQLLMERYGGRRLLVAVDDAHSLDSGAATLLSQLAALGYFFVAASARVDERLPAPLERLVKDQVIAVLEIGGLADQAIQTLIRVALGGDVDPDTSGQVVRLVAGNPLFLRELLDYCVETGALQVRDGLWRLDSSISISPTLRWVVDDRIGRMHPEQAEALEALALAHPLELALLSEFIDDEAIVDLERRHVIDVRLSRRRRMVTFSHPLLAESVRSTIPTVQQRRLSGHLLRAIHETGARRRGDPLRLGLWHLESGEPVDAGQLTVAANQANTASDHPLAEQLASAAVAAGAGLAAQITLADAISRQGRVTEAEVMFSELAESAIDPPDRVAMALLRAENAGLRGGALDRGIQILKDARESSGDPVSLSLLDSQLALFLAFRPDLDQALAAANRVIEEPRAPDDAVLAALTHVELISLWRCDFATLYAIEERALRLAQTSPSATPDVRYRLRLGQANAWTYDGQVTQAVSELQSEYEAAVKPPIADYAGFVAAFLAQALRVSGALRDSNDIGRNAVHLIERTDPTGSRDMVYALHAVTLGELGDAAGLNDMATNLESDSPSPPPRATWSQWARGWSKALAGDIPAAVALFCAAGEAALEDGIPLTAAWALHDAVRWDASDRIADLLRQIANRTAAVTINAFADHATALVASDPESLEQVAAGYVRRGENLYAVHAYVQAASLYRRHSCDHAAACAATKARQIATLATQLPPDVYAIAPQYLTKRETQIGTLAAQGISSKEIATRLYIADRTVDNHLASIFTKLGIHSRAELAEILTPHSPQ